MIFNIAVLYMDHPFSMYVLKGAGGGLYNAYIYCLNDIISIVLCVLEVVLDVLSGCSHIWQLNFRG